ncbi:MAG: FAD-dependent oxidoreductase [Pseudomonadota bacterium]
MPFEYISQPPLKIAVIGSGVSGLGAAHLLSSSHRVTLFEAENRLGGHARTVVAGKRGDQPVDTGFIVFNDANYPRLTRLFDKLDLDIINTDMSFGVSAEGGKLEYAFKKWYELFSQRRNIVRPKFYAMLLDVVKFNKHALNFADDPSKTLGDLLHELHLGDWFRRYYLLPFSGAIWSTPITQMLEFPAASLTRFFENHNLMQLTGAHQWKTIKGGSIQYVSQLEREMGQRGVAIRTCCPVQSVRRGDNGVWIKSPHAEWEHYDRVIFACHSDQAIKILEKPTAEEKATIGAISYCENRAVLHADKQLMPNHRSVWSSWNYVSDEPEPSGPLGVTYWMNMLQSIPEDDLIFNSLNPGRNIREELIYDEKTFFHPVFDKRAIEAQKLVPSIQGLNNTWYCGAYLRNGFHEDGYSSAVDVVENMGAIAAWT